MYLRKTGEELLSLHPAFQPRMRAILLDWLMEVCEVYRLHRETFYLAVDYIDRYMSVTRDMPKARLQLIGKAEYSSSFKFYILIVVLS
jgi:cyclin E